MSGRASPTETADACPEAPPPEALAPVPASPVGQGPGLPSLPSPRAPTYRALPGSAFEGLPKSPCPLLAGLTGFLPSLLCSCLGFAVCIFFFPLFKSQAKGKR